MFKFFANIKVKTLSKVIVVLMLVYIATSSGVMLLIKSTSTGVHNQTITNDKILISAFEVYALSTSSSTYLRTYIMTDDATFYDRYEKMSQGGNIFDERIAEFVTLGVPDAILTFLYSAADLANINISIENDIIALYQSGDKEGAIKLFFGDRYTTGLTTILDRIKDFEEAVMASNKEKMGASDAFLNSLIKTSTGVLFGFITVFFGVILILLRLITSALDRMGALFKKLAAGDLTDRVPNLVSENEIYKTYNLINAFVVNVSGTLKEVSLSTDEVASGNNELAVTTEELSTTFNSQSEQVTTAAADMETISDKLRNVVDMLQSNSDVMDVTVNSTEKGQSRLSVVKSAMQNINQQTDSLSGTITKLSDSSAEIGNIITVINDIADQTNLLALNAAIEAARAGEAGRGFAVVADEVRKLAERTQKATSEIEQIISTLQNDSEIASTEMKKASTTVSDGVASIEETEEAFNEIFGGVNQISETTASINVEVSQNYDLIRSISESTQMVAAGIEESTSAVAEFTSTVGHLQKRVEMLKNKLAFFTISDDLDKIK